MDDAFVEALTESMRDIRVRLSVGATRDAVSESLQPGLRAVIVDDRLSPGEVCLEVRRDDDLDQPVVRYSYRRDALPALVRELRAVLSGDGEVDDAFKAIRGTSQGIELVREQLRSVAKFSDVSVLVLGETGTGKELVARALHEATFGPRAPFVAINCAAIPEALLESELFGHEAGAYTGARGVKPGLLEAARGGSLFLDEIGEMPPALQPKLLRVLESREFRRVGSTRAQTFDARVLSATNREPWDGAERNPRLRSDLTYRLAGFTVRLPPLRERGDDVEQLAWHFLSAFEQRYGRMGLRLSSGAMELLRAHDWPGNIRQLRATVEHAAILARDGTISAKDIRSALLAHRRETPREFPCAAPSNELATGGQGLRTIERELILKALQENRGNVSRAARQLGIPRSTLRSKLERILDRVKPS